MSEDLHLQLLRRLSCRKIRPTAIRIMILREMLRSDETISLPMLESFLPTVDKSSISRTLSLFLSHRLIHVVDDGSGTLKYAVCSDDCECSVTEQHSHFSCLSCGRTFCLKRISAPLVDLPEGFKPLTINYVVKGLCPTCQAKEP